MTDGLIILYCDYCEQLIGYIDTKPLADATNIVGAQPCCIKCYENRQHILTRDTENGVAE